ncbi:MAG TPA: serine--tRNA ligase [bacterium]|nr:serine--tRNA ligase [bacterium]
MLDIKRIREETQAVLDGCRAKGYEVDLDAALKLDDERRRILGEAEKLQHERNVRSKEIGNKKKAGEDAAEDQAEVKRIGERIQTLEQERRDVEAKLEAALLEIPNPADPSVPPGRSAEENELIREGGPDLTYDFQPKPHWDVAERLGLLDFERGVKVAGSGFPVYVGIGARLERALIAHFLDLHTVQGPYREIWPPILVNEASARGTGQLPDKEGQMYVAEKDELYLIPTSEVPVTNLHRDEILPLESLPVRYAAYTPNFRREAGSHGKEVRGLNRVHQFNKVELVKMVEPSTSEAELESLVEDAERVLKSLGLKYRILLMCAGEMGFTQARQYDLEVWAPGQERWLEVSSCSNFRDFQARRMKIRYRPEKGKPALVHTLNGSGLATSRIYVAILEQFQRADGSVEVPEPLRAFVGTDVIALPQGGAA